MNTETNEDDGWIDIKKQLPTEADADELGQICYFTDNGRRIHDSWRSYLKYDSYTHWRRSFPPPRIKTQAELEAEEDEKAWAEYSKDLRFRSAAESVEVHEGFKAGRASMRGKGGK